MPDHDGRMGSGAREDVGHSDAHGATRRGGGGGSYRSRAGSPNGNRLPPGVAAVDAQFQQSYPALCEYMTSTLTDGKPCFTATVLFFCEEGKWKACVRDRERDMVCFRSSESFTGLLEALERALADGGAEWRHSTPPKRK